MARFHINSKGDPGPCNARKGKCPFGGESGEDNHYDSMEAAATAAMEQELRGYPSHIGPSAATNLAIHPGYDDEMDGHPCAICGTEVGNEWDAWCDACAKQEFNLS